MRFFSVRTAAALLATAALLGPVVAYAHQPRIVEKSPVVITDPEVSKAYYATLSGEPQTYTITSSSPFTLYLQITVPDKSWAKKDVSAAIILNGDTKTPLAVLDAAAALWKPFYEPFGNDKYLKGPEFKSRVGPGTYEIRVWSTNNDSKYSLAVGEIEKFDFKETWNAISLIPHIKQDFFNESSITFLFSVFGLAYAAIMLVLGVLAGVIARFVVYRKGQVKMKPKNIGLADRLVRFMIGVALLVWAVTGSWNPLVLFFAGLAFYEAFAHWCVFYAAIGRNSCPSA